MKYRIRASDINKLNNESYLINEGDLKHYEWSKSNFTTLSLFNAMYLLYSVKSNKSDRTKLFRYRIEVIE